MHVNAKLNLSSALLRSKRGHGATGQNTSKTVQSHCLHPSSFQELEPAAPHKAVDCLKDDGGIDS